MKQEVVKLWTEALRSGEYPRGEGTLNLNGSFCCLGVLCDLYHKETGKGGWEQNGTEDGLPVMSFTSDQEGVEGVTATLSEEVRDWAGMKSIWGATGDCSDMDYRGIKLTKINDRGASFVEIADIIEKNADDL